MQGFVILRIALPCHGFWRNWFPLMKVSTIDPRQCGQPAEVTKWWYPSVVCWMAQSPVRPTTRNGDRCHAVLDHHIYTPTRPGKKEKSDLGSSKKSFYNLVAKFLRRKYWVSVRRAPPPSRSNFAIELTTWFLLSPNSNSSVAILCETVIQHT